MAQQPRSKTDLIREKAAAARRKNAQQPDALEGIEEEITGVHEQLAELTDAVRRAPMQSSPQVVLVPASTPDSTPPVLKVAWRYRSLVLKLLLALAGAFGAERVARWTKWLE